MSVGRPSKPCYRIGARQLAQLAFGKLPGASHGTSFALMVPDKPTDQSCLPSQGVTWLQDGEEDKYIALILNKDIHMEESKKKYFCLANNFHHTAVEKVCHS